jgi:hypothetical protein
MGHALGCTCQRCRNRQALGEDEGALWGCALVVLVPIVAVAAIGAAVARHVKGPAGSIILVCLLLVLPAILMLAVVWAAGRKRR